MAENSHNVGDIDFSELAHKYVLSHYMDKKRGAFTLYEQGLVQYVDTFLGV